MGRRGAKASAGLLAAAVGVPKRWPKASPWRVCRVGLLLILAGILLLLGGNADLEQAMKDVGQSAEVTQAALEANTQARIDGLDAALAVLALIAVVALFFTGRTPRKQPGSEPEPEAAPAPA